MNRIARAWVNGRCAFPFVCPICHGNVGGGRAPAAPSERIPLIVERTRGGQVQQVALHAGCQSACNADELAEIRPSS
jgi:hypothetical protein